MPLKQHISHCILGTMLLVYVPKCDENVMDTVHCTINAIIVILVNDKAEVNFLIVFWKNMMGYGNN